MQRENGKAEGQVALTFDDGPGPQTLDVLEELQREHAVATFFVIGANAKNDPDTVRTLYKAGMQIGNHTWTHPQLARLTASKQESELKRTQDEIASIIGVRPRFYRPPYWSWNMLSAREGAQLGMIGVLFSVDTRRLGEAGNHRHHQRRAEGAGRRRDRVPRCRRRPQPDRRRDRADHRGAARAPPRAGHARPAVRRGDHVRRLGTLRAIGA